MRRTTNCASTKTFAAFHKQVLVRSSLELHDWVMDKCKHVEPEFFAQKMTKALAPIVLDHLYKVDRDDFENIVGLGCLAICNQRTYKNSVALAQIVYREAPLTVRAAFYRAV